MSIDPNKIGKTFCPSPWVHFRLGANGQFTPCRWAVNSPGASTASTIYAETPLEFFHSDTMNRLRHDMVAGNANPICKTCLYEDSFGKLSGRQKQLFRFGLTVDASDKWTEVDTSIFEYSYEHGGQTNVEPIDFQIVTSNTCNSSCIMCGPGSSSKISKDLATNSTLRELSGADFAYVEAWRLTDSAINRIVDDLETIPYINYVHLIGGEPFYDKGVKKLMQLMVDRGIAKRVICGTATNATIYDAELMDLMAQFQDFHLGISIDAITSLNDYIRYPSKIDDVTKNISDMLEFAKSNGKFFVNFRPTPNIFTVYYLPELFEYFITNGIIWETCDILFKPTYLRMELMPDDIRRETIDRLRTVAEKYGMANDVPQEPDTRNPAKAKSVMTNSIHSYINFLSTYQPPATVEADRYALVAALKQFESLRGNRILAHAPRYEEFLRRYGYQ